MVLIGRQIIEDFKQVHADVRTHVDAWTAEVTTAHWQKPSDVKQRYPKASILPGNQVVFDLKGNNYRLLVQIAYQTGTVMVKKIGTHKDYMKW